MSWWDTSNLSSFATQALKSAQQSIDKVLEIKDDGSSTSRSGSQARRDVASSSSSSRDGTASSQNVSSDGEAFWNSWRTSNQSTEVDESTVQKGGHKELKSKGLGARDAARTRKGKLRLSGLVTTDAGQAAWQTAQLTPAATVDARMTGSSVLSMTDDLKDLIPAAESKPETTVNVCTELTTSSSLSTDDIKETIQRIPSAENEPETALNVCSIELTTPASLSSVVDVQPSLLPDLPDDADQSEWTDVSLNVLTDSEVSSESALVSSSDSQTVIVDRSQLTMECEGDPDVQTVDVDVSELSVHERQASEKDIQVEVTVADSTETEENVPQKKLDEQSDADDNDESLEIEPSEAANEPEAMIHDDSEIPEADKRQDQELVDTSTADDELSESNRTLTSEDLDASSSDVSTNTVTSTTQMAEGACLQGSSYVKTLLEEAMTESSRLDNADSSSHSSSDVVHVGSGHNSGHTSTDEVDTTTSSDIEVISHRSTPNGSDTMSRASVPSTNFDLSPLRHAFNTRRSSHARSDSGSSDSRHGEEAVGVATAAVDARSCSIGEKQTSSTDQPVLSEEQPFDTELLLMKLAKTAEILDVRERKLMKLSQENVDLEEALAIIKNQLQQSEEVREAEMADVKTVTEEFTQRLTLMEKNLQTAQREKEQVKKKLEESEVNLDASRVETGSLVLMLEEKEEQVSQLMTEGEKLSKQQLTNSNIIKKLRTKEKETDTVTKANRVKIDEQKTEIEHLKTVLDSKIENEKKQTEVIKQLNNAVLKQDSEGARLKTDLEDLTEKNRSLQVTLDNSYKELAEMHKANVTTNSRAQEAALNYDMHAKEDLRLAVERGQREARLQQEGLLMQIEDLRLAMSRQEKDYSRCEELLKQEIADLQQRQQESEERNQHLTQHVTAASRPLLRQIENLQSTCTAQSTSYEKAERHLADRLAEMQSSLAVALEKERLAVELHVDASSRLAASDAQVSSLRQERSRLQAALDSAQARAGCKEEALVTEVSQLEMTQQHLEKDVAQLKSEKTLLQNHLEVEKMKTEAEKKKLVLAHELLKERETQLDQARKLTIPSSPAVMTRGESMSSMASSVASLTQDEMLERTLMMASANGSRLSVYETLRTQGSAATLLEGLQSQLKQQGGEIAQLQTNISELEYTRESMARELVNLSTKNESQQERINELVIYQNNYQELDQRYNALLQMYGEKEEKLNELTLDLADMKELYKSQINELLGNT